jgi:hypothetical protein
MTKLLILARLVVNGQRGDLAVMKLNELCGLMTSMLSAEARDAIAQQWRDLADASAPPSDHQRRLH